MRRDKLNTERKRKRHRGKREHYRENKEKEERRRYTKKETDYERKSECEGDVDIRREEIVQKIGNKEIYKEKEKERRKGR